VAFTGSPPALSCSFVYAGRYAWLDAFDIGKADQHSHSSGCWIY
jgi:hypothetical protein